MALSGMGRRPQSARVFREPVATFLTIEPFETRLEVLVRLAHASEWVDVSADQTTIEIDQRERAKLQLIEVVADRTVLQFDGNSVAPAFKQAFEPQREAEVADPSGPVVKKLFTADNTYYRGSVRCSRRSFAGI
jgi:hypothetical protein